MLPREHPPPFRPAKLRWVRSGSARAKPIRVYENPARTFLVFFRRPAAERGLLL